MQYPRPASSITLFALFLMVGSVSHAAVPDDNSEARHLLSLLEEETEVATKTRLNADYVPGILTVLYGNDLETRGVRTVAEALETIPGVQVVRDRLGFQQVAVRGVSSAVFSGNVKVLFDDVPMNSTRDGMAHVLNTPIELVDRIEMVRGPGSAVHGEYAYVGVINIISHEDQQRVYGIAGQHQTVGGGAVLEWSSPEKDARATLGFASWRTDGTEATSGPDALFNDANSDLSNSPGPINDDFKNISAILKGEYKKFGLVAHYIDENQGEYFGINYILPEDEDGMAIRNRTASLELRRRFDPSDWLQIDIELGGRETLTRMSQQYVGPPEIFGFTGSEPILWDSDYEERESGGEINWLWKGIENQLWLLGLAYSETEVLTADYQWNVDEQGQTTNSLRPYPGVEALVQKGTRRRVASVTLQNETLLAEEFSLTAGARYDHYSDAGDNVAPRIAAVWRPSGEHIFKAQYASAFRPPTFTETATSPATIKTLELAYINKGVRTESRITLFGSTLDDLVAFSESGETSGYVNVGRVKSRGIELEHERSLNPWLQWNANISYSNTEDEKTGEPMAGTSDWLGNLGLIARPFTRLTMAASYRFVGPFHRESIDSRDDLDGYQVVDLTGTWASSAYTGLTYRIGVKNLFDAEIRHPAWMTLNSEQQFVPGYADDLPTGQRTWWAQVSYHY